VTRLDTRRAGAAGLEYSSYVGGGAPDRALGLDLKGDDAFITGFSESADYPVTANAYDGVHNGGQDMILTRLDTGKAGAAGLEYSTYLGGDALEDGFAIQVRGDDAWVSGGTASCPPPPFAPPGCQPFPTTANAYDRTFNGGFADAFVTRLDTKSRLVCPPGVTDPDYCEKKQGHITLRNGAALVGVTCPSGAPGRCAGTVQLRTASGKRLVLGSRRYKRIAAGSTRGVRVKLSKRGLRTLKRHKRLRVDVLVRGDRGVPSGRLGTYTLRYKGR
jgi:hypothetical protein